MGHKAVILLVLCAACAPKPIVPGSDAPIRGARPAFGSLAANAAPSATDPTPEMAARIARLRARAAQLRQVLVIDPETRTRFEVGIDSARVAEDGDSR